MQNRNGLRLVPKLHQLLLLFFAVLCCPRVQIVSFTLFSSIGSPVNTLLFFCLHISVGDRSEVKDRMPQKNPCKTPQSQSWYLHQGLHVSSSRRNNILVVTNRSLTKFYWCVASREQKWL